MPRINISDIIAVPHLEHFASMLPHQCDHGGRAAYKSSKNAIKIAKLTLLNPTIEVIVFRQDYSDHKNSTFRDLIWAYESLGVKLKPGIHYPMGNDLWIKLPQGNYIHFQQMKQKDKLKGYRPTKPHNTINIAWFFEITEYKEESYIVSARSSVMREAGEWFICFYEWNNAPKLSDWTYEFKEKMEQREDAYVKKTNYCDAPEWQQEKFLGKPLLKEIEMLAKYDPEQFKSEYLGYPANLGGTVYKQFSRDRNVKPATHNYIDITMGVDIGGNDATTFVPKGFIEGYKGMETFSNYYHKNGVSGGIKNINDYITDLLNYCEEIHDTYGLPITVYVDTANLMFIQLFDNAILTNKYAYIIREKLPKMKRIKGSSKKKSILQGRADMNNVMFGSGYHTIDPSCKEVIKAFEEREYNKQGDPADDGSSDVDTIDASDYGWLKEMDLIYDIMMG